jgi:hypothetical protein
MIAILVLGGAVALLVVFVLGIVTGAQLAAGRAIPWGAQSRQAVTAEALAAELTALRAELTARPIPHPAPVIRGAVPSADRLSLEGSERK